MGEHRLVVVGFDWLEVCTDLPVVDPRELPDEVVDTLAECFDDLRRAARRGKNEAPVIDQIDTVLQREL